MTFVCDFFSARSFPRAEKVGSELYATVLTAHDSPLYFPNVRNDKGYKALIYFYEINLLSLKQRH